MFRSFFSRFFGSTSASSFVPLESLNSKLDGEIIFKDSKNPKYENERKQWNSEFNNLYPKAIIKAESEKDISMVLKQHIIPNKTPFSVRSAVLGGHLWSGYSVKSDGLVLDLSRFNSIVHTGNGVFKIGVGASQRNVNRNLEPFYKIVPTSGDCNQFSMGGFIQGGGLSLFLRSYGISADYVIGADVVLTNGEIIHATMDNEYSDLLYGIKGGGAGNYGIVTNYYMKAIDVPNSVLSFEVYWDLPKEKEKIVKFLKFSVQYILYKFASNFWDAIVLHSF